MPRKQRFKPSRKPKPQVNEGFPQDQTSHQGAQDIEAAQPVRHQGNYSTMSEADAGPK